MVKISTAQVVVNKSNDEVDTIIIIIISTFVKRHKVVTSKVLAAVGCVC